MLNQENRVKVSRKPPWVWGTGQNFPERQPSLSPSFQLVTSAHASVMGF